MTTEKRERRWCLCGWTVTGTDEERAAAFAAHWETAEHEKRLGAR